MSEDQDTQWFEGQVKVAAGFAAGLGAAVVALLNITEDKPGHSATEFGELLIITYVSMLIVIFPWMLSAVKGRELSDGSASKWPKRFIRLSLVTLIVLLAGRGTTLIWQIAENLGWSFWPANGVS